VVHFRCKIELHELIVSRARDGNGNGNGRHGENSRDVPSRKAPERSCTRSKRSESIAAFQSPPGCSRSRRKDDVCRIR
jgi:hypothetical protein